MKYLDASAANTTAVGGVPKPFFTNAPTADDRWRFRPGLGFDELENGGVFEKDATFYADGAMLETVMAGLEPNREYGIHVLFLSDPSNGWGIRAGLEASSLTEFRPNHPAGRVTDLGRTSVPGSNRRQFLGFIANATADEKGEVKVFIDDTDATSDTGRCWYEGLAAGVPVEAGGNGDAPSKPPSMAPGTVELAPDGAWTWFNDERSVWHGGYLFVGYVCKNGQYGVTRFDPATSTSSHMIISTETSQGKNDHNNPSLTVLPGGKLLVVYSGHNSNSFWYRESKVDAPSEDSDWGPEQSKPAPAPTAYSNTHHLAAEPSRLFNFHRSINFNPTLSTSDDLGSNWNKAVHFIATGSGGTRPYPKYASNKVDRIDLIYTDGHPRNNDNSVYHLFYRKGAFHETDGTLVKSLKDLPMLHDSSERGSVVYSFSNSGWSEDQGPDDYLPGGRAWTWDVCHQDNGDPVCAFQVQVDNVTGNGWNHDRIYYYYAWWNGMAWERRFVAHGGRGLYEIEDDYGGGMAIDPENPNVIYISSNAADPFDLEDIREVPLGRNERYELYRGVTEDGGRTFDWEQLTFHSIGDNLRPIVTNGHDGDRHVIWFEGRYATYLDYDTRIMAIIEDE
ncbi:MAG: BNR-4 repeat-containing protein [Verrucomicrobiota bacterium]